MIEADLRTHLLAQASITALIGARLYPQQLPQGTELPAVTYQRIAGQSLIDHEGAAGIGRARIQLDCWGESYGAAAALADTLRLALSGYRGAMGSNPATNARVINILDVPEPELALWRRMVEISLSHEEV